MSDTTSLDAIVVRELIESVALVVWAPADHVRLRELVEHVELVDHLFPSRTAAPRLVRD
jgi:hypothetical protein